jgi:hypothetical protein
MREYMGIVQNIRQRALSMLIKTFEEIDTYNIANKDAKMLDIDKLTAEVMYEFSVSEETARIWIREAQMMNKLPHEDRLRLEARIRKRDGGENVSQ